jgi:hypothetical protein
MHKYLKINKLIYTLRIKDVIKIYINLDIYKAQALKNSLYLNKFLTNGLTPSSAKKSFSSKSLIKDLFSILFKISKSSYYININKVGSERLPKFNFLFGLIKLDLNSDIPRSHLLKDTQLYSTINLKNLPNFPLRSSVFFSSEETKAQFLKFIPKM